MSMAQNNEPVLKSYTGTYIMYVSDGKIVVTGREKFKNYKAVFPLHEVESFIAQQQRGRP